MFDTPVFPSMLKVFCDKPPMASRRVRLAAQQAIPILQCFLQFNFDMSLLDEFGEGTSILFPGCICFGMPVKPDRRRIREVRTVHNQGTNAHSGSNAETTRRTAAFLLSLLGRSRIAKSQGYPFHDSLFNHQNLRESIRAGKNTDGTAGRDG